MEEYIVTDEMEVLLAEREVPIGDKKIIVKRYSLMSTIKIASKASGIATAFLSNSEVTASAFAKLTVNSDSEDLTAIRLLGMIELISMLGDTGAEFIRTCIAYATVLTDEEIDDLDPDAGIDLIMSIFEVNKGFFTKCLNKLKVVTPVVQEKKPRKARAK